MKIMIRSDIEGVTGVTTYKQAEGSDFGKRMLMNDLLACINGIRATGEHEISIYDEHTDGRNVDITQLPEGVSVIMGKPDYRSDWGGIDSSCDALMMVGFHARSGAKGALLPHSYSRKNLDIRINGTSVGEIGMEAAIVGDFGVSLWLVTGDSAGIAEAKQIIKGVKTVIVKEAMGEFAALCYGPKDNARRIFDAAKDVMVNHPVVSPLTFESPVTLEIDLANSDYTDKLKTFHPELVAAGNTVKLTNRTVTGAWSQYLVIQKELNAK